MIHNSFWLVAFVHYLNVGYYSGVLMVVIIVVAVVTVVAVLVVWDCCFGSARDVSSLVLVKKCGCVLITKIVW